MVCMSTSLELWLLQIVDFCDENGQDCSRKAIGLLYADLLRYRIKASRLSTYPGFFQLPGSILAKSRAHGIFLALETLLLDKSLATSEQVVGAPCTTHPGLVHIGWTFDIVKSIDMKNSNDGSSVRLEPRLG